MYFCKYWAIVILKNNNVDKDQIVKLCGTSLGLTVGVLAHIFKVKMNFHDNQDETFFNLWTSNDVEQVSSSFHALLGSLGGSRQHTYIFWPLWIVSSTSKISQEECKRIHLNHGSLYLTEYVALEFKYFKRKWGNSLSHLTLCLIILCICILILVCDL